MTAPFARATAPEVRPAVAADASSPRRATTPGRQSVRAFVAAAAGMFAYEAAKTLLLPELSLWESHAITILVGAVTAAGVAHVAVKGQVRAERRLAEADARRAALEAREATLAESEARYRLLVESSPEAIAVHRAGRVRYANAASARLLGVTDPTALVGRATRDLVHPDDFAHLVAHWRSAPSRPSSYRLLRPDGDVVEVEAASVPVEFEGARAVQTVFRDVTARKRLEAQLLHQAFHDPLTGLANRALFRDRVSHALERSPRAGGRASTAVIFLDLDDFKSVNDRLGHLAGDQLLVAVAERLRRATRGYDTVARLGGDEFAVLLEELADRQEALMVARRITSAFRRPFGIDAHALAISASLGLAAATPDDGPDELLRNADVALYEAKASGKARHAVFEPAMYAAVVARLDLEAELRRGVESPATAGFHLAYQPLVELRSGRVTGVETLLRWDPPGRGPVSPATFIPVAEETGLIVPLGRWVLVEACAELMRWAVRWAAEGRDPALLPGVAVNISGRQLAEPDFVSTVATVLRATGVSAHRLTLEITESVLLHRVEDTLQTLRALKALGVQLAIDDFGTGYSSLSYLQRFPVDVLKIDRAFVDGVARGGADAALARTIIALGDMLGLRTVAEGVEDAEQRDELRALGCHVGQGYLFARPGTAADLQRTLFAEPATGGQLGAGTAP